MSDGLHHYNSKDGTYEQWAWIDNIWNNWAHGHIQRDIPAVVYDICPGFPSPEELGMPLNEKQTARSYKALVKQHPGDRVKDKSIEAGGYVYQRY